MVKISIEESTILSVQNGHKVVMVYDDASSMREATGNVFLAKETVLNKDFILEEDIPKMEEVIQFYCKY